MIPPGPPNGSESSFKFEILSSILNFQAQLKLKLINPFNFNLNVERVQLKIAYDDVDGVAVGGTSYRVKTKTTDPPYGNMLSGSMIDETLTNFVLVPNVAQWTPKIGVPVGNLYENARRLYDEYNSKDR